ncbi:portal protein, partial [Delftia tsuruhatensis]|uniref:portal protein n=1 Tax=Delftia tsuruhatensis TaxID=180282 RepID=UPI00077400F4
TGSSPDWRNVLWDSMAMEPDLSDARYLFRTRWVDEDVAITMYPQRRDVLERAVLREEEFSAQQWAEDEFFFQGHTSERHVSDTSGSYLAGGRGNIDSEARRRVRLIECQFRMPASVQVVTSGPFKGSFVEPWDHALRAVVGAHGGSIVERVAMRMHVAVFTEGHLLALGPTPMRHNSFSLTPIWCYRRGRDRMPYGVVRRVRDLQMDLNKRASKALFLLSTNQIFAEKGAFDDINEAREEVNQPDGVVIYKAGKKFEVHRDSEMAAGQVQMMTLDGQAIQKSAGISDENLGRRTNAVSGRAIEARQLQGSVVTTQPFDNLRFAVQIQGEKLLSLVEQWYTEEKVIRLSGHKGRLDWVKVNQPEVQPDGSVRYLNDITSSMADFVVSEQDYSGTLRQVMFESLNQLAGRLPPEVAIRIMTLAMEYSDLPNNDLVADELRKLTGERDPNKPLTPEEQQQVQQQMQAQAEALQMQQESARQALAEQQAKVREINARAEKLEAEAEQLRAAGGNPALAQQMEGVAATVRRDADLELDELRRKLSKTQADLANKTLQIKGDQDVRLQVAHIEADSRERVAQIQAQSRQTLDAMSGRLNQFDNKD